MCAVLSDVIDSQYSLGSYHEFRYGLRESGPFSRLSKCPIPFYFPLKIAPPLPFELNTAMFASRNVSCSAKVRKIKPNIKYRGKEGKKQNTVKNLFFFSKFTWKIIRHLCYLTNIKTQYNSKSTYYENEVIFAFTKNFCWGQTRETE